MKIITSVTSDFIFFLKDEAHCNVFNPAPGFPPLCTFVSLIWHSETLMELSPNNLNQACYIRETHTNVQTSGSQDWKPHVLKTGVYLQSISYLQHEGARDNMTLNVVKCTSQSVVLHTLWGICWEMFLANCH